MDEQTRATMRRPSLIGRVSVQDASTWENPAGNKLSVTTAELSILAVDDDSSV